MCLESVQDWSFRQCFDYHFVGDEIFDRVPDWYREKTQKHLQIATDLGRLHLIKEAFDEGYDRAIWLDADVLVFAPDAFVVEILSGFAFGREIWVQKDKHGKPKAFRNVHNAYSVFCRDNRFLTFYQFACERIISRMEPGDDNGMLPQIVGPKLLTSLHNTLGLDLTHDIAMFSPDVLSDIDKDGGPFLDLLCRTVEKRPVGANLGASLSHQSDGEVDTFMGEVCRKLLAQTPFPQP